MKSSGFCTLYIRSLLLSISVLAPWKVYSQNAIRQHHLPEANRADEPVHTIFKDSRGSTWFGSGDGLCLFDGTTTQVYRHDPADSSTISHNQVTAIIEDTDHNVWIGTEDGLNRYNTKANNFTDIEQLTIGKKSLASRFITCLATDNHGQLWIGTADGLNVYNLKTAKIIKIVVEATVHDGSSNFITAIVVGGETSEIVTKSAHFTVDTETLKISQLHSKGINSEGPFQDSPWLSWWAMLAYALFIIAMILTVMRIRKEKLRIKRQLTLEKITREKQHALTESKMFYFTNISHELRTPLSLILIPLEKIAFSKDVPDKLKASLSTAYKNASNLMKLVNELMDISKSDAVKPSLHVRRGDCVSFVAEVADRFQDVAEQKQIKLSMSASSSQVYGWYDADKLEKIVRNLLSNAFKFTHDGGEIELSITTTKHDEGLASQVEYLELVVRDNGIGIAADELPRIFEKFFQAKSTASMAHTGSGIGLSLTQSLVHVHHGTITVESSPGEGTKFLVRLPIAKAAYTEAELHQDPVLSATDDKGLSMSEYDHIVIDKSIGKPELLVIEDNDELRKFLVAEFSKEFSVTEAATGDEGFTIACDLVPDLIVSDIVLPGKCGLSVCRDIKSDIRTSHIPVILLTAKASTEDHIAGLQNGADVYIPKPFSIRVLQAQVNQVINSRRKLYTRYSQDVYLMPANLTENTIDKEFLQKAVDYINNNLRNSQLSVESMAELFSISRSQVYRKIKALTGQTVVEFIRTVRLKFALTLMEEKKFNLSEIADRAGFNSLSYFTRSFKDHYGKAPSEYIERKKPDE